jgi:hypothetical protein
MGRTGGKVTTTKIETVTGLPSDDKEDEDEESFGFGVQETEREETIWNPPEVSMQSEDPPLELSILQKELAMTAVSIGRISPPGSGNHGTDSREDTRRSPKTKPVQSDPPARTVDGSGTNRPWNRRWRSGKTSDFRQIRQQGHVPFMDGSSTSPSSSSIRLGKQESELPNFSRSKSDVGNRDLDLSKFTFSAPWNRESFLYRLLYWSLEFTDELMTILQDRMFIANTESFLEFFKASPEQFLVQIPLPLEKIQEFKVSWMKASMVANFFIHQVHPGEQIKEFAGL